MRIALATFCMLACASLAEAHDQEAALQISTGVLTVPALVNGSAARDMGAAAMVSLAGEYNVHDDVALRLSAGYAYGLNTTSAGAATLQDRFGRFSLVQDVIPLFAGVRLDSRTWLLPLTLSLIAEGGTLIVMQSNRALSSGGLSYGLPLGPQTIVAPAANITLGLSLRATDQLRIGLDPSVMLLAHDGFHVGFSVALSFAFLRFM